MVLLRRLYPYLQSAFLLSDTVSSMNMNMSVLYADICQHRLARYTLTLSEFHPNNMLADPSPTEELVAEYKFSSTSLRRIWLLANSSGQPEVIHDSFDS